jgi:hypothetical protein
MAARSGTPRAPRRNEPKGVGTWKRARRRHLGSPHSTRNRLRLTKRRRAYAAAGRSDLAPSRTRPGANFRRLRARQSKGTSRLGGRDSRQSETLGRTAQPSVISLREAPHPSRRSCESRGSPPAGRCPRNLGEDALATPTQLVELALREVAPGATRNTRSTVLPATIAIALRSGLPPLLPDNQEAHEQVGGRDPQLKALSLT